MPEMQRNNRIITLLQKNLDGSASVDEIGELDFWKNQSDANLQLYSMWMDEEIREADVLNFLSIHSTSDEDGKLWEANLPKAVKDKFLISNKPVHIYRNLFVAAAAAAALILVFSVKYFYRHSDDHSGREKTIAINEILVPGTNKAILTLANGTQISLNSNQKGVIASQGKTAITKADSNLLIYSTPQITDQSVAINVLTTPRGGQYRLRLPDGTDVWLNAASSISYPTIFTGKERKVKLTGEAYFEVAKNKAMPFKVQINDVEVKVLGTHFNIMAYLDEPKIKTTLLEGSIELKKDKEVVRLIPGQQAIVGGDVKVVDHANTEEAIAWKNEIFQFNNISIEEAMRTISRWYNVDVKFEGRKNENQKIIAVMSRNTSATEMFQILTANGFHLKFENNQITVTQ